MDCKKIQLESTCRTHKGETVSAERLTKALNKVANQWIELANLIRQEDEYASHVTEVEKEKCRLKHIASAERARSGDIATFSAWQDINTALRGDCISSLIEYT